MLQVDFIDGLILPGPNEKKIWTAASAQTWKMCKT